MRRFANALVPLDEALVQVALDLSGRPFLVYDVDPVAEWIGTFDPQLCEEFWRALTVAAGITLHLRSLSGRNGHHVIEASFKGVARSLRDAVRIEGSDIPSTKGTLSGVFTLYPAIDLRAGRAVRLTRGDFAAETVYADDPVAVARAFAHHGRAVDPRRGPRRGPARGARQPGRHRGDHQRGRVPGAGRRWGPQRRGGRGAAPRRRGPGRGRHRRGRAAHAGRASSAPRTRGGSRSGSTPGAATSPPGAGPSRRAPTCSNSPRPSRRSGSPPSSSPRSPGTGRWRAPTWTSSPRCSPPPSCRSSPAAASGASPTWPLGGLEVQGRRLAGAVVGRALYEGRFTLAEALAAVTP